MTSTIEPVRGKDAFDMDVGDGDEGSVEPDGVELRESLGTTDAESVGVAESLGV